MTGWGMRWMVSIALQQRRKRSPMNASFEWASISFKSWPGQNARPAPAMTTTRTDSSSAMASSAACMSSSIAPLIALNCAGRLSVSVAMPSACDRRTSGSIVLSRGAFIRLPDGACRFRAVTQHELLDLAGRRLRQFAEDHVLRRLEPRQVFLAMLDQLLFRGDRTRLELDE